MCACLIVGATFAMFTSNAKVNIAVTSGNLNVVATVDDTTIKTKQLTDTDYVDGANGMYAATAAFSGDTLTLNGMIPGDGIKFDIKVSNNSTIAVKYRTIIACENDNGLFEGLTVSINGAMFDGFTAVSEYVNLAANAPMANVPVTIELAADAGNEYQNKTCTISYKVEVVQANADTENVPTDVLGIYDKFDLITFAKRANADKLSATYKTVKLFTDIDLEGVEWAPIDTHETSTKGLARTFDGNGHTISNMTVVGKKNVGFFGCGLNWTIVNLTMDNANVTGINHVAAIAGDGLCTYVENCVVKNSSVTSLVENNDDGDKAALIVGYLSAESKAHVKDCTVIDCRVEGYRDVGGIVGYANTAAVITGNKINGLTLLCNPLVNYKEYDTDAKFNVNPVVGVYVGNTVSSDNTTENVVSGKVLADGFTYLQSAKKYEIANANGLFTMRDYINNKKMVANAIITLNDDIDMAGKTWTSPDFSKMSDAFGNAIISTFDGQRHTISNMEIEGKAMFVRLPGTVTIKNIIFENCNNDDGIEDYYNTNQRQFKAIIVSQYVETLSFENVEVKGAAVRGYWGCGVFVGYAGSNDQENVKVTFKDCKITDCSVDGWDFNCGGFVGIVNDDNTTTEYYGNNVINGLELKFGRMTGKAEKGVGYVESRQGENVEAANVDSHENVTVINSKKTKTYPDD